MSRFRHATRIGVQVSIVVLLTLGALSCDHGLAPITKQEPGFGGRIQVTGNWPASDSLQDFRIIAFREYPPRDLLLEILANRAIFSDKLPFHEREIRYSVKSLGLIGSFAYVVAAQQYGPRVEQDWRAVGVHTRTGDPTHPSAIVLEADRFLDGIDLIVNFVDLPPQPF